MRILVTNEHLDQRAGSEAFVRDLVRGLQRLGHFVIAYSSDPRQRERLLERDPVAVATDLERLPFRPDIIHARHHLDAMSAVLSLPGVPAIHHCPSAAAPAPLPRHPRIYAYVVPAAGLAERLRSDGAIAAEAVEVVPAGLDLARFSAVRTPSAALRRALIYDDGLRLGDPTVEEVRGLAARLDLDLDLIGRHLGRVVDRPEAWLPGYDLVFASGRPALEALACGCAVVIVGPQGIGAPVRAEDVAHLREADFAPPSAPPPVDIAAEIARHLPSAAAAATREVRRLAPFGPFAERLDGIYRKVVARHAEAVPDADGENRAAARYLAAIMPMVKRAERLQRTAGDLSPLAAAGWLDASARLAAIQRETDKLRW